MSVLHCVHSRRAICVCAVLLLMGAAGPAAAGPVALHLLVDGPDGPALESVPVPAGRELVVTRPDLVTVVLPFGIGQSGDMVPKGRRPASLVARVDGGVLHVTLRAVDGRARTLPDVDVADLSALDLRVNVIGAGGRRYAFVIAANGPASTASGPVIDMFQGKLPLGPGDWSITTEVTEHARAANLSGTVALERADGLLFARVKTKDGRSGRFVVDTAAGVTVVARAFLPADTKIDAIEGVEHSESGVRVVPGVMEGAGGGVSSLLGAADVGALVLDTINIDGVRANVVASLPALGGAPIDGILGLDVLSRCERLRLEHVSPKIAHLTFGVGAADAEGAGDACPFTVVAKHLVFPARMDGVDVSLVLDTGARVSLIPNALAARAKLAPQPSDAGRTLHGLDGKPLPANPFRVNDLQFGPATQGGVTVLVAELPVLRALGLDGDAGLLGGDLLGAYRQVVLDFPAGIIRFVR
jgi:hypothetical protein